jgi:hypothetical protein
LKKVVTEAEVKEIGRSGPIDADGSGHQLAKEASSINVGREGAGCDVIEIMQIPPRFEQSGGPYSRVVEIAQVSVRSI